MTSAFEFPKCSPVLFVFSLVFDAKNKCIGDDTNAAARQILNCIKNKKMWHVALESWQWIHQVAAPCNVICDSGMTCHWICTNVRHIGILHLVSILTTSPQSTCHSAPVSEILSKSDHPRPKKMTSCRFSRWWISAILDFMGAIMGSLKSPCRTSYRSSTETIACLVFEKFAFLCMDHGDRRMDRRTNRRTASIHKGASRYRGTSKCIGDDTNATARQSLNCNKNKKNTRNQYASPRIRGVA